MGQSISYAQTGVDIAVTDAAKREMAGIIDGSDDRVLNRLGAFASLVEGRFADYRHPILVLKTEEPGSKQKLAFELGRVSSIAYDLVNHLVNDVSVMGAAPFYVQDCIICGTIDPGTVKMLVAGMADACKAQSCVLTGGETSVQPGVVPDGVYILSASAVGVVDKDSIIDGSTIVEGDVILAVGSNGLHTNGYTLVRKLLESRPELRNRKISGGSVLDVLMRPHMCYYHAIRGIFRSPGLRGIAHITGGGIEGNLNRILPRSCDASIDLSSLRVPEVFRFIRAEANVTDKDMLRTFNMGVGLTVVCSQAVTDDIVSELTIRGCEVYPIGEIITGSKRVKLQGRVSW